MSLEQGTRFEDSAYGLVFLLGSALVSQSLNAGVLYPLDGPTSLSEDSMYIRLIPHTGRLEPLIQDPDLGGLWLHCLQLDCSDGKHFSKPANVHPSFTPFSPPLSYLPLPIVP